MSKACGLCTYVGSILKAEHAQISEENLETAVAINAVCLPMDEARERLCSTRIDFGFQVPSTDGLETSLTCILEDNHCLSDIPPLWTSRQLLKPDKRFAEVKQWLEVCQQEHHQCQIVEASIAPSCPTRLIDLSLPTPRLVSLPASTKVKYVALSHCWGADQPIKSTQDNLRDHFKAIPTHIAPKTYRDAIAVTQRLGIQYIWIDSLCIIQDDNDMQDWEQEAANMAAIYEGAVLTIAAAWGKDGTSGCFHDNVPSLTLEVEALECTAGSPDRMKRRFYLRPCQDQRKNIVTASLNLRAWTLQELVLSRRIILFAEDQWYWLCNSTFSSEDGLVAGDLLAHIGEPLPSLGVRARHPETSLFELYETWESTVHNYSARSLTHARDKLAALAGAVDIFQRIAKDVPLLGLWKNNLHNGLMWHVGPNSHSKLDVAAVQSLNIPSWSWTKMCGLVDTRGYQGDPCFEISSASVTWTGVPLTSKIKDHFIEGRGKILPIAAVQGYDGDTCMCRAKALGFDVPLDEPDRDHRLSIWFIDECVPRFQEPLKLLLAMTHDRGYRGASSHVTRISALLVVAVPGPHSSSIYRRVGLARLDEFPRDLFQNTPEVEFTLN